MVCDLFYVLLTLRYNESIKKDNQNGTLKREDVSYMMVLRLVVNMWLYINFIWYGCIRKDVQLDDLEGLDEEDFENLRITNVRNTQTMFSMKNRSTRKSSIYRIETSKSIKNVKHAKVYRDQMMVKRKTQE